MYEVWLSSRFKKDLKKAEKRRCDVEKIMEVVGQLAAKATLDKGYRDHELSGNWAGYRECHIAPDWLLVYKISDSENRLTLARTGSHSDIFG